MHIDAKGMVGISDGEKWQVLKPLDYSHADCIRKLQDIKVKLVARVECRRVIHVSIRLRRNYQEWRDDHKALEGNVIAKRNQINPTPILSWVSRNAKLWVCCQCRWQPTVKQHMIRLHSMNKEIKWISFCKLVVFIIFQMTSFTPSSQNAAYSGSNCLTLARVNIAKITIHFIIILV